MAVGAHGYGKELRDYRDRLAAETAQIDSRLGSAADTIDGLRHRTVDVDEAVQLLQAEEDELDQRADALEDMLAPQELHGLHMEYEANLERALRGIVTAERGCAITRLPTARRTTRSRTTTGSAGSRTSSTRGCACGKWSRCCWPGSRASAPR